MSKDDLLQVKHIGPSRLKMLHAGGVTTIEALQSISVEELATIKTIGPLVAARIKSAVGEIVSDPPRKEAVTTAARANIVSKALKTSKKGKPRQDDLFLKKRMKHIQKQLKVLNEESKPLWEKKYLGHYLDFKKRSNKLVTWLKKRDRLKVSLSQKARKKILKQMDSLERTMKKLKKKRNKKQYKAVIKEVGLFSKVVKRNYA